MTTEHKSPAGDLERRMFPATVELRDLEDGQDENDPRPIGGHGAVFGVTSEMLFGFRERFARGAFEADLEGADIRSLFNHDPNMVLGRSGPGTLRVWEDETGLAWLARTPPTSWARDLAVTIGRGDVDQGSIGFRALDEDWGAEDGIPLRTVTRAATEDIGPVTFPAYPATETALRAARDVELRALEANPRIPGELREQLERIKRGEIDRLEAAAPVEHIAEIRNALRRRRLNLRRLELT